MFRSVKLKKTGLIVVKSMENGSDGYKVEQVCSCTVLFIRTSQCKADYSLLL